MTKDVTITVSSSVYDVLGALIKGVSDVKAAVKAGGSAPQEGVAIVSALVADLFPIMGELAQIGGDISGEKIAAEAAVLSQIPALIHALTG
ncbi:MAG: hypothetical protein NVS3B3_06670 [Aquirhabdus sp.]